MVRYSKRCSSWLRLTFYKVCKYCDGLKFVNYVKLKQGEKFTDKTVTTVRKCLKCLGTGRLYGIVSEN